MSPPQADRTTVLVLGVGGNVSQGILKALAASSLPTRVVAACVNPLAPGLFAADRAYVSPLAADPDFIPWVKDICDREGVRGVLSGSEPVLSALAGAAGEIERATGAVCVVSPPEVLAIGHDKLATCRWLEERGLPHPRHASSEDGEALAALVSAVGFPLVSKPRSGKAARGVVRIDSEEGLREVAGRGDHVVQEYLDGPSGEYTCGCFCDREGAVRGTVVMRRELLDGTTVRAEALAAPEIAAAAESIVSALAPMGPCNVQMRVAARGPVPFELNVRFSGTTPVRARLGFNEVEAALRHHVLGEPMSDLPRVEDGVAVRYWNEMYVSREAADRLRADGVLEEPHGYPRSIEPWGSS